MSWADSKEYGEYFPVFSIRSKRKEKLAAIHAEKKHQEAEAKAKAEKEYAAKQASVDTDITNASNGKGVLLLVRACLTHQVHLKILLESNVRTTPRCIVVQGVILYNMDGCNGN